MLGLRLAGKRVFPGALAKGLREAGLAKERQLLSQLNDAHEKKNNGNRPQTQPAHRARAGGKEEELHRPPFRHQILLPIRRGEA